MGQRTLMAVRWGLLASLASGILVTISASPAVPQAVSAEETSGSGKRLKDVAVTVDEARGRARLLHETLHGVLLVVHRDYYREDEGMRLPSRSLEDVFADVANSHGVMIRWLAVNAQAMNIDHEPQDEFEKQAAAALAAGRTEFGAVEAGQYRHVGRIRLASECLKCHVPSRTNTKDRAAGLVITIPTRRD